MPLLHKARAGASFLPADAPLYALMQAVCLGIV